METTNEQIKKLEADNHALRNELDDTLNLVNDLANEGKRAEYYKERYEKAFEKLQSLIAENEDLKGQNEDFQTILHEFAERVREQQRELEINAKKEDAFLNNKDDMIAIYQIKRSPENRDISFIDFDNLEKMGKTVDRNNYDLVYICKVNFTGIRSMPAFLESVFEKFNIYRPKDFKGHSLSVSDVVAVKKDGQVSAYFVDSIGFKELPQFGQIVEKKEESNKTPCWDTYFDARAGVTYEEFSFK